jgi:uncharacterized protein YijF (DUF1287 family)
MLKYLVIWLFAFNVANAHDLKLVNAVNLQVGVTKQYDPNYTKIDYPNGDIEQQRTPTT